MNQGKNKKLTDRKGSPTNRSAPEQEDTDPTLSDATPPRLRADIDIEAMDESSAEFSAVMSLLSRVRSQPASEQKMFSGSFISGIGTNFADGLPDLPLPKNIGRFEIRRCVGEGGYGQVLLAWDPRLNREIALKIPRAQTLLTRELRRRFIQEATAAASLNHPNIVTVFEAGREEDLYFIASKFCPGLSLAQWLKRYPERISIPEKAKLISVMADAVHHAHKRGILHRDLKPANVLIESPDDFEIGAQPNFEPERARITDFGLALVTSSNQSETKSGAILGTPAYISPEQSKGEAVGPATDIYSLGIVLYELLTGKTPFQRDQIFDTLQAARTEEPKPPSRFKSDIPADLEAICLKCLEKDPSKRYESAFEVKLDLARFLDGVPVRARRVSRLERFARMCKRNPALSFATSAAAVLTVCLAVGSTYAAYVFAQQNQILRKEENEKLNNLEEAIIARDKATKNEKLAIEALFEARISEAQGHRRSRDENARTMALASIDKAAAHIDRLELEGEALNDVRNETIAAMSMVGLELEKKWPGVGQRSSQMRVAFDADAKRYARIENDNIAIRSVEDNRILQTLPSFGRPKSGKRPLIRFSSQGTYLAVRGKNKGTYSFQVWKLNDTSKPVIDEATGASTIREAIDFSPDERLVAFASDSKKILIRDLSTLKTTAEIETENVVNWIQFDPTSLKIAVATDGERSDVNFCNAATGSSVGPALQHSSTVSSVAWHPNARWLATGTTDGELKMWDTESGEVVTKFHGHRKRLLQLAFNHRGSLLMSTGWDSTTRLWEPISGQQLVRTIERGVSFSKDDTKLTMAVAGSMIGRWNVTQGDSCFALPVQSTWPAFNVDNRVLAMQTNSGVEIWDIEDRKRLAFIPGNFYSVQFNADGTRLNVASRGTELTTWQFPLDWSEDRSSLVIGEPKKHRIGTGHDDSSHASFSSNSSIIAAELKPDAITVIDLSKEEDKEIGRLPGIKQRYHAVSSDGAFAVTGSWRGEKAKIWKTSGELIRKFDFPGNAQVAISPDDRWIGILTLDRAIVVDTSTWETHFELPHRPFAYSRASFSGDGRVAAITTGGRITVVNVAAKKILARITPPIETTYGFVTLSPNGRWLVVADGSSGPVQAWDLSRLRDQLSDRNVDWKDEVLYEAKASDKDPGPLKVIVAGAASDKPPKPEAAQDH